MAGGSTMSSSNHPYHQRHHHRPALNEQHRTPLSFPSTPIMATTSDSDDYDDDDDDHDLLSQQREKAERYLSSWISQNSFCASSSASTGSAASGRSSLGAPGLRRRDSEGARSSSGSFTGFRRRASADGGAAAPSPSSPEDADSRGGGASSSSSSRGGFPRRPTVESRGSLLADPADGDEARPAPGGGAGGTDGSDGSFSSEAGSSFGSSDGESSSSLGSGYYTSDGGSDSDSRSDSDGDYDSDSDCDSDCDSDISSVTECEAGEARDEVGEINAPAESKLLHEEEEENEEERELRISLALTSVSGNPTVYEAEDGDGEDFNAEDDFNVNSVINLKLTRGKRQDNQYLTASSAEIHLHTREDSPKERLTPKPKESNRASSAEIHISKQRASIEGFLPSGLAEKRLGPRQAPEKTPSGGDLKETRTNPYRRQQQRRLHRQNNSKLSKIQEGTLHASGRTTTTAASSRPSVVSSEAACSSASTRPSIVTTASGNIASRLPWRDRHGIMGNYTGYVNDMMQPHGQGALVYRDGSAETSVWENGYPKEFWCPEMKKIILEVQFETKPVKAKKSRRDNHGRSGKCEHAAMAAESEDPQPPERQGSNETKQHHAAQADTSLDKSSNSDADTFLPHLDIGDAGTPDDMVCRTQASHIESLKKHDFAFVLRSEGVTWTYAIIANRQEDVMRFVVDTKGGTKELSRKRWMSSIRVVNQERVKNAAVALDKKKAKMKRKMERKMSREEKKKQQSM